MPVLDVYFSGMWAFASWTPNVARGGGGGGIHPGRRHFNPVGGGTNVAVEKKNTQS